MGNFLIQLDAWFSRRKRVLPWRDQPTLYRVWVSEIMLQQTQVATVVPYFEKFLARFPTVESLAQAPADDVMLHWAGLGYYSRARNLHAGAGKIVSEGFPRDRDGWLEIPGVGEYTAGAILSIALDRPEAILDGNVERVLSRVRRVNRRGGDAAYKRRLWRLSRLVVERAHAQGLRPSQINQALMELGATTCTPRKPVCASCPLSGVCRARAEGDAEAYPPKKKPKEWIQVKEEVHCVLDSEGRLLLRRRRAGEWRAGLWDLLDEAPSGGEKVGVVESRYVVTRHKVSRRTHVWRVKAPLGAAQADAETLRWVRGPDEVPAGAALKKTLAAIRSELDAEIVL